MTIYSTRQLLLAGAALLAFSAPAFALDGNDLMKKINAAYNLQGGALSAASVDVDGTTVTLKGVKFAASAATGAEQSIPLGDVKLEGVEEEEGSYYIETAKFQDIDFKDDKVAVKVTDMYVSGMTIPADMTTGTIDSLLFYEEAHSGPIHVSFDGVEAFSLKETTATMSLSEDENEIGFDFAATGLNADLSGVTDPKSKEAIEKLDLQKLAGSITIEGTWKIDTGTIDVTEYALDLDQVGRLNLALGFSGYTMPFIKTMQETIKAQAENPDKEQASQAAGLAMLGLAQQLSFINAEISFKDAGITKRGIDYAASEQGMKGDQFAMTIKAMTPVMVAQLGVPALQTAITEAVNKFIDKPGNLTIAAKPAAAVPFPSIMGAAMTDPKMLVETLGVTVSAND